MPYGGTTPAQGKRIEKCVRAVLAKVSANPKKYRVSKDNPAKSIAIRICKSLEL